VERLKALAEFLVDFERPGFRSGKLRAGKEVEPGVLQLPYIEYDDRVDAFVETAYGYGWMLTGAEHNFDWTRWKDTNEAIQLRDDENSVEGATEEQLARLLTVLIRAERFCEGTLFSAFENGFILRIVRRAAVLAGSAAASGKKGQISSGRAGRGGTGKARAGGGGIKKQGSERGRCED